MSYGPENPTNPSSERLSTNERIQNAAIEVLRLAPGRSLGLSALVDALTIDRGFFGADVSAQIIRSQPPLDMDWLNGKVHLTEEI